MYSHKDNLFIIFLGMLSLAMAGIGCKAGDNNENKSGADCATKPAPIFADSMQFVSRHQFQAQGQNSSEEVLLSNGVRVDVFQSGCQRIRQTFHIRRQGDTRDIEDPSWIAIAYRTLGDLSLSSPSLQGLEKFARHIAENRESIRLGQPFSPEEGLSMTVDKIASRESGTIIVSWEQL